MVAKPLDLPGSDAYVQPWAQENPPPPPDPGMPPAAPAVPHVPYGERYEPAVERLRPMVEAEFARQGVPTVDSRGNDLIDKTLHVATYESHGDTGAVGDGGRAYGAFQSHYIPQGTPVEGQVADAVRLIAKNPDQFTDWGEGVSYMGKPFGALGRVPYGTPPPGGYGGDIGSAISGVGSFVGGAASDALERRNRALIPTGNAPLIDQLPGRQAGGFRGTEMQPDPNATFDDPFSAAAHAIGKGVTNAYDTAANTFRSIGPAALTGDPTDTNEDPFHSAIALQQAAEKASRDRRLQAISNASGDAFGNATRAFTSGLFPSDPSNPYQSPPLDKPAYAVGDTFGRTILPDNFADYAMAAEPFAPEIADAARTGTRAVIEKTRGAFPEAAPVGSAEYFAGLGGGGNDLKRQIEEQAARDAEEAASKPLPGQGGLFGGTVDESGKLAEPEMPAHPSTESLRTPRGGQEAGQQIPAFERDASGETGQMGLAESLTPKAGPSVEWSNPQSGRAVVRNADGGVGITGLSDDPQKLRMELYGLPDTAEAGFALGPTKKTASMKPGTLLAEQMDAWRAWVEQASDEELLRAKHVIETGGGRSADLDGTLLDARSRTASVAPEEAPKGIPPEVHSPEKAPPTPLPPANGLPRESRTVPVSDLEFRPDLFQARDTTPGKPFGEARANEIASNWDDAKFIPPDAVPDPEHPGKYIVFSGHHRTEAFARVFGQDAHIPVNIMKADITDPEQLAKMQSLARSANFDTAPPNFREQVRAAQAAPDEASAAKELRRSGSKVQELQDAARLGSQAIDRATAEPALEPYVKEIGRAMRLHGINEEDANGMLNRIADATKTSRPTPGMLRETLDKFGAILAKSKFRAAQGGGFGEDFGAGDSGGLLKLIDENARTRTQLARDIAANKRAMSGASKLAEGGSAADQRAADRLVELGSKQVEKLQAQLTRNETNLNRAARGLDPLPEPKAAEPKAAAPRVRTPKAAPETAPPAASNDVRSPASSGGGAPTPPAPPRTPPPRGAPVGEDDIDQLIAHVEAAGAMKPDLAIRRKEELASRIAKAEQRLIDEGAPPEVAFKLSRKELVGQLADPSFVTPGDLNTGALHQHILDAKDLPYFTRSGATDGLDKLIAGQVPANHEIEALGQVFGPRLQQAIEDMGDILKVQGRVESQLLREPINITFADNRPITPDTLGELLQANLPGVDKDKLDKVAERLIDEDKIKVVAGRDGKQKITIGKGNLGVGGGTPIRDLAASSGEHIDHNPVPEQTIPPVRPKLGDDSFQPNFTLAPDAAHFEDGIPNREPTAYEKATNFAQHGLPKIDRAPLPPGVPEESRLAGAWRQLRAVITSPLRAVTFGHSDVLRTGLSYAVWHPAQAREALHDMWAVILHPSTREALEHEMSQQPFWKAAIDAGWVRDEVPAANRLKEAFADRALNKVPLLRNSSEARGVYQSAIRKLGYEADARWLHASGVTDPEEYRALFDTISDVTGHGLRGKSSTIGGINTTFSPGAMMGRFRSLTDLVSPEMGMSAEKGANFRAGGSLNPFTPGARGVAARNILATGGIALSIEGLAKASGMNLNWNLLNTPLGKVQFGASTLDPTQGYSTIVKLAAQLVDAADRGDMTKMRDSLAAYMRGQLGPVNDMFVSTLTGKDWQGKHFNLLSQAESGDLIKNLYVPIAAKAIMDAWKVHGPAGALFALPSVGAMSVETNHVLAAKDDATKRLSNGAVKDYASAGPVLQAQVKKDAEVIKAQGAPTAYQEANAKSKAPIIAETGRQEDLFKKGQNTQTLRQTYHDEGVANRQSAHDLEDRFAQEFKNFSRTKYQKAVEDYYNQQALVPQGEDGAGNVDFDKTAALRADFLAKLPPDLQTWVKETVQVAEDNKTDLQKGYDKFVADKKAAGYFRDGITPAERTALDKANPGLDVAGWKYGYSTTTPGTLNSVKAANEALALNLPNRPVKLDGMSRPINETPGTLAAWQSTDSKGRAMAQRAQDYIDGYANSPVWKAENDADRDPKSQDKYGKPYAKLEPWQKKVIDSGLLADNRREVREDDRSADLHAYLAWSGVTNDIADNDVDIVELRKLRAKYGRESLKDGAKPITYR